MNLKSVYTAERPQVLEADAAARYSFAARFCRNKRVLDIGTGLGLGANYLARQGAKSVLGIDYSVEAIRIARKNAPKNAKFITMEIKNLSQLSKKFDVILAFEIIEHLPTQDIDKFSSLVFRLLFQRGRLLVSTPNGENSVRIWGRLYNPYHVQEYTPSQLKNVLKPYFKKSRIWGIKCVNASYFFRQSHLEKSLFYKMAFLIGSFKLVREALGLIPRDLKRKVTGETSLPLLSPSDYQLDANTKNCPGLFMVCYP